MSEIAHLAALWSLVGYPSAGREWPLEKKIAAVAAAGFDGISARLTPEHRRWSELHGLRHLCGIISASDPAEYAALLGAQKAGGAVHINVQLDDHDTPPAVAVQHWAQLVRTAEAVGGVVVSLEVHRDCCTETPEKTYEIADRFHAETGQVIKLNFDFSHFALVKHLWPSNYAERLLARPELVQNSELCHLRPFNGHHCQVPVVHRGRLTPEVKSFLVFAAELMRVWRAAPCNQDRTLFACPEMGAYAADGGGYNITCLPPAWPDAVALRRQLAKAWRQAAPGP